MLGAVTKYRTYLTLQMFAHMDCTAFTANVFPTPGGPTKRIPATHEYSQRQLYEHQGVGLPRTSDKLLVGVILLPQDTTYGNTARCTISFTTDILLCWLFWLTLCCAELSPELEAAWSAMTRH